MNSPQVKTAERQEGAIETNISRTGDLLSHAEALCHRLRVLRDRLMGDPEEDAKDPGVKGAVEPVRPALHQLNHNLDKMEAALHALEQVTVSLENL